MKSPISLFDSLDAANARDHNDSAPAECFGDAMRYRFILDCQQPWSHFEHMHVDAKRRKAGGHLAAGRCTAHHNHLARQFLQRPDIALRQRVLAAWKGKPARMTTYAEDELLCLQSGPIAECNAVFVNESSLTSVRKYRHTRLLQVTL
jgi:hypothetical protein